MSSTVVSYSFVSPRRLEVVVASGRSSAWARAGVQIWRVKQIQNHGYAVLYRLEWRIMMISHKEGTGVSFVGPFPTNWTSKAVQNFSVDGLIHVLAFGEKFVIHLNPHIKESCKHYLDFWLAFPRWRQRLPLWWYLHRLRTVAINPWVTSGSNAGQVGGFVCGTLQQLAARGYHAASCCNGGSTTWLATAPLPPAPPVCGIRTCCQMCCMVVAYMLIVISP